MHSATPPLKIYFRGGQTETLLGWVTSGFELYAAFGPLVTKPAAINVRVAVVVAVAMLALVCGVVSVICVPVVSAWWPLGDVA